jgi:hypothetical protein
MLRFLSFSAIHVSINPSFNQRSIVARAGSKPTDSRFIITKNHLGFTQVNNYDTVHDFDTMSQKLAKAVEVSSHIFESILGLTRTQGTNFQGHI